MSAAKTAAANPKGGIMGCFDTEINKRNMPRSSSNYDNIPPDPWEGEDDDQEKMEAEVLNRDCDGEKVGAQIEELKNKEEGNWACIQKNADTIGKINAQIINLNTRLGKLENQDYISPILELQSKLKETIRAVEKLAKGKSLGALGLPTEESWATPSK